MKASRQLWETFVQRPGALVEGMVGIASECAIGGVIAVIAKRKPKSIIEYGSGIGTLTWTVIDAWRRAHGDGEFPLFYSIENNAFCLEQLETNLGAYRKRVRTVASPDEIPPEHRSFEFMIVDGGGTNVAGDIGELSTNGMLSQNAVVLVEGGRKHQRDELEKQYAARLSGYAKISSTRLALTSPDGRISTPNKGYHVYLFDDNKALQNYFTRRATLNRYIYRIKKMLG